MKRHERHNSEDLADGLEHVVYEMWKYKQSVAYYERIMSIAGDAAIEFRVLHHRVLLEFFYGVPKHPDNIFAWEYVASWREKHDPLKLDWLAEYRTRCHTLLAHISTTRSDLSTRGLKRWDKD